MIKQEALSLDRLRAGDNLRQLCGDGALPQFVVSESELGYHIIRVFCGALHSRHAGAMLRRHAFTKTSVHLRAKAIDLKDRLKCEAAARQK